MNDPGLAANMSKSALARIGARKEPGWHFAPARLLGLGVALLSGAMPLAMGGPAGEPLVERTMMPDAAPSSFAVGFPNGVGFCFDPVRGGVRYAWRGGFVDLAPARPGVGKFIEPARLPGAVAYRETGDTPLRRGDPARVPAVGFKGYRLHAASVEFHYTIDGVRVQEEVSARPQGDGLIRRFRLEPAAGDARWWYVPGPTEGATPAAPSARFEDGAFRFDAGAAREFTIEIVFPENS
jgi:hypothetical protein